MFSEEARSQIGRPIPGKDTLLAANPQPILGAIREHYDSEPTVINVLLCFRGRDAADWLPESANRGFELVPMKYEPTLGNYIEM